MKCVLCRTGETRPGTTTETYELGGAVVVVRGVPTEVCRQCGEERRRERRRDDRRRHKRPLSAPRSLSPRGADKHPLRFTQIPEEIRERMCKTPGDDAARREGVKIAREMLFAVQNHAFVLFNDERENRDN